MRFFAMTFLEKALKGLMDNADQVDCEPLYPFALPHPNIPTGNPALDLFLGGPLKDGVSPCPGLGRGEITLLIGGTASGKSTLAKRIAHHSSKCGRKVLYVDTQCQEMSNFIGCPGIAHVHAITPPDLLDLLPSKDQPDLVILDDVVMGLSARPLGTVWHQLLPSLTQWVSDSNAAFLALAPARKAMPTHENVHIKPAGGNSWAYFAHLIITIKPHRFKDTNDAGFCVKAQITKDRRSAGDREDVFRLMSAEDFQHGRGL